MDAMIGSMTPKERSKPELINAKRKIRIAQGSGTTVQDVNKLLKMHQEMSTAMKKLKKMGGIKGMMAMLGKGRSGRWPGRPGQCHWRARHGRPDAEGGGGKTLPGLDALGSGEMPKLPPGFEGLLKKK